MQIHLGYLIISSLILASYPFIGLLLFIHKRIIFTLSNYLLIFTFGTFWGNILFHLLPATLKKLPIKEILIFLPLGMLISWTIDKFIQHKCQRGINSIAYHLFSNDVLHNFMDGIIILLSYGISPLSGISSTLAVLLHEIPHELCEWGIMLKANFSYRKVVLLNLIAAMVAIAGMGAAYLFFQLFQTWTPYFVATITGNFIFIANAKLLPLALRSTMPIVTFRNLLVFFSGFLLIGCSNFIHPHLH